MEGSSYYTIPKVSGYIIWIFIRQKLDSN